MAKIILELYREVPDEKRMLQIGLMSQRLESD